MCSIEPPSMWPGPKKSDQTKEEDCALWWELFPQPWFAKLLHTKVTFLWLPSTEYSPWIWIWSQPQRPCYTAGPWLLMPAMELHAWDKAVKQDASSEYPLTPLSKDKCLLFFSVWRLNRIRWALCEWKILAFTDIWIESVAVGHSNVTRTWCFGFFCEGM